MTHIDLCDEAGAFGIVVETDRSVDALMSSARILVIADLASRALERLTGRQRLATSRRGVGLDEELTVVARELGVGEALLNASEDRGKETSQADWLLVKGKANDRNLCIRTAHAIVVGSVEGPPHVRNHGGCGELPGPCLSDPLATRLALLRFAPEEIVMLTAARLNRAQETLKRWRFKMAGWHDLLREQPPADRVLKFDGLVSSLDTRSLLVALRRLEANHGIPSAAKYQAFTLADDLLRLDLCRLVGKHLR